MKKIILLVAAAFLLVLVISCKKAKENVENQAVLQNSASKKVDLDLTKANYNIVSSIAVDIMFDPEKYAGKKMKISGLYYSSVYEDQRFYSVLIWDATGCCPTGFDFIPPATMTYPDDFPANDEKITVTGLLDFIKKDGQDCLVFKAEEIL